MNHITNSHLHKRHMKHHVFLFQLSENHHIWFDQNCQLFLSVTPNNGKSDLGVGLDYLTI